MPATFTVNAVTSEWTFERERAKTTGTTVYRIQASEPTTPAMAALADGVPGPGSDYPGTTGTCWCQKASCKADGQTRMLFRVECEFDSTNEIQPNPLLQATKFSTATESFEETFYEDETTPTKKLARHTNNVPFTELPKRDNAIDVITTEKNVVDSTTNATVKAMRNKVNSGSVTLDGVSYTAGQLRVTSTALSEVKTENSVSFRTQTIVVKAHPNGWDQKYESMGFKALVSGVLQPIADPTTQAPVTDPWPLTTAGAAAATLATKGAEIVLKPYKADALAGIA